MSGAVRTVHVGLGPIGRRIVQAGFDAGICRPVAAADLSPEIAGKSLHDLAGREGIGELSICDGIAEALDLAVEAEADLAVVCTGSHLQQIEDQFAAVLERGLRCISTCEELVFPWLRSPEIADNLDNIAIEHQAALLAAGVNPGFVLDLLPYVMTRVCESVQSVYAGRFVDASRRRQQLQAKIGSGMTVEQFRALAEEGRIGHVGLTESAALLADSLGWAWDEYEESLEPVVAEEPIRSEHFEVAAGEVRGQHQRLSMGGVTLELVMALGEDDLDEVRIEGTPPVQMLVGGGIHGDVATAGTVINFMRPLMLARPGLRTVTEVPPA